MLYVQFTTARLIICLFCVWFEKKASQVTNESHCCRERRADLNMHATCFSPSLVWAWRSPCTWPAEGPHQTCPPDWAEGGLVGQRGWSAVGSTTGRGRAPSWPRPRRDTSWSRRRTAGSWATGWSDLCLHCSRTDLQRENTGIRISSHKQNHKPHIQGFTGGNPTLVLMAH